VAQQIDQHTQGAPVARRAYTDADFANLAHDDSHNVGLLDRFFGMANSPVISAISRLTPLGQVNNAVDAVGALAGYNPGDLQTSFQHGAAAAARSVVRGIGALGDIQHKAVNAITGGNRIASFVLQNLNPLGNLPGMSDVQPATQWLGQKAQELENSVQQHGRLAQGADMIGGLIPYLFSGEFAPITMALSGAGNQADAAERQGKYGTTASDIGVIANAGFQGLLGRFIGGDAFAKLAPQFGKALADGIAQRLGGGTADIVGRAVGGLAGDLAQGITNTAFRAAGAGTVGLAMQGGANIIEAETVNPTKDVTEGLGESAGSMAILDLAMHGLRVAGSSVAGRYAQAARARRMPMCWMGYTRSPRLLRYASARPMSGTAISSR
jgi:hypothetical protein